MRSWASSRGKHPAGIAFQDDVSFDLADIERVDVAFGIVEIEPGGRNDPAHRTTHLATEQDVLVVDHVGQQIDAGLVIDADCMIFAGRSQQVFSALESASKSPRPC